MAKKGNLTKEQRREKIVQLIYDYKKDRDVFIKKLNEKYFKILEREIQIAIVSSIEEYYSYDTNYVRKESLYRAYEFKPNKKNKSFSLRFLSDNIETLHPGKGEYIYEYMFELGWHGGDIKGNGHPSPGTPWLRYGVPIDGKTKFVKGKHWLRQASQTEAPYDLIVKNVQEIVNKYCEYRQEEYESFCNKRLTEINRQINIYITGGSK